MIKKLINIFVLVFVFVFSSCQSEEKGDSKSNEKGKELSEKTDLRQELNGYWVLISQSFTKGRKLEKFPVGGTVNMIIEEHDNWYTLRRMIHMKEDTISAGTLTLVGDQIVFEVLNSKDEASYVKLEGKIKIDGRFMQVEGMMSYDSDKKAEYTHMMFGRSARSLEEILEK